MPLVAGCAYRYYCSQLCFPIAFQPSFSGPQRAPFRIGCDYMCDHHIGVACHFHTLYEFSLLPSAALHAVDPRICSRLANGPAKISASGTT